MEWIADPNIWIAFGTLTLLELVLGIDNIIFISILSGKLPVDRQPRARFIGLSLALVTRVILLFSLSWVMTLTEPLFHFWGHGFSGRDLILIFGGLFLIGKSTHEIHGSLEGEPGTGIKKVYASFASVIVQMVQASDLDMCRCAKQPVCHCQSHRRARRNAVAFGTNSFFNQIQPRFQRGGALRAGIRHRRRSDQ